MGVKQATLHSPGIANPTTVWPSFWKGDPVLVLSGNTFGVSVPPQPKTQNSAETADIRLHEEGWARCGARAISFGAAQGQSASQVHGT